MNLSRATLSTEYLNPESYLNNIKRISINSDTEWAMAVALVDGAGNHVTTRASTGTLSNVGDSASSVTLLAANTDRKGCIIFNDSTAILYVKFGATASTSSFTLRLTPYAVYEMTGPIYSGVIDGIWASDAGGNARLTELT